jgi:beta-glucanase (GH16 family)
MIIKKITIAFLLFCLPAHLFAQEFLRWSDEFNGTALDTNYWVYQIGDGCPNLCGWGNGELQSYQKSAVVVEGGLLKVKAKKETIGTSTYSSGRIRSINKFDFASGRIEVRARTPIGKGYWPAVWFLPTENYYGNWPLSGEIDLLEGKGQEPTKTYGTIHYGAYSPNNRYTGATYTLPIGSFASEFHTFELSWKNDTIQWFVDNVLFSTKTRKSLPEFWWPYDRNFHFLINLAVGGNFLGYPDASTPDTATLQIDYVRVYQDLENIFISGPEAVLRLDKQKDFYTQKLNGATYNWSATAGIQITSGQGTPNVKVNWGLKSDSLFVTVTHLGNTHKVARFIETLPDTCLGKIDDSEFIKSVYWVGGNGTQKSSITNPAKDAVNQSNLVNRYYRNGGVQYDALTLHSDLIRRAKAFEDGTLILKMKLYTTAPVGTEININFENRQLSSNNNYPVGRRCVIQAKTTKSNSWEELSFKLILRPDLNMSEGSINQLVMLFAPNTSGTDVYFYDDFAIQELPCKETLNSLLKQNGFQNKISVQPNPFSQTLDLKTDFIPTQLIIIDLMGRVCIQVNNILDLNDYLGELSDGAYVLEVYDGDKMAPIKIVKVNQ